MWPFKRKGAAVAEPPFDDFAGDDAELRAEIERLSEAPDREAARRSLRLRHIAGTRALAAVGERPPLAAPDFEALPDGDPLPELTPAELTPGVVRAGILRDGCVLVRGLVPRADALEFADLIERAFRARADGERDGYYEEFEPDPRFPAVAERPWIEEGGGLLGADSPLLTLRMLELFRAARLPQLVAGYLGEPALFTVQKTTLRKAEPSVPGAWHQDGAFLGDVRALNLWLSLSRCGDEAPGLDLVPRRLERFVSTQTDEAVLSYQVSQRVAEEAAANVPIVRPVFEPGDALLFDELFLHQTGSDPAMPNPRYAIENWFFGATGFPREFAPLAV
jgi:hypothetical protein